MYLFFLSFHSLLRWLVLASLMFAIYRACKGWFTNKPFSKFDDAIRHWTATIAHIQFMIGMIFYFQSPIIKYFMVNFKEAVNNFDIIFFGFIHSALMITAIVLITIGSAKSKRKQIDQEKFKTMLVWFSIA